MNLFSRDQYVVDEVLIRVMSGFFRSMTLSRLWYFCCTDMSILSPYECCWNLCGHRLQLPPIISGHPTLGLLVPRNYDVRALN
jgi:hypothetical protein